MFGEWCLMQKIFFGIGTDIELSSNLSLPKHPGLQLCVEMLSLLEANQDMQKRLVLLMEHSLLLRA